MEMTDLTDLFTFLFLDTLRHVAKVIAHTFLTVILALILVRLTCIVRVLMLNFSLPSFPRFEILPHPQNALTLLIRYDWLV